MSLVEIIKPPDATVKTPAELVTGEIQSSLSRMATQMIADYNRLMKLVWSSPVPPDLVLRQLGTVAAPLFMAANSLQQVILFAYPDAPLVAPPYDKWSITFHEDGSATVTEVLPSNPVL